ncbi:SDR family oxidoreductase [Terasakiispira papahanaumokuakeensis]|nr:SDR family oxidoreductase [Terasakiispira papahanaumokuakeensis]
MMGRLAGKYALITGGSSGIGLETARQFLAEGAQVAITGRDSARLQWAQKTLGPELVTIQSDAGCLNSAQQVKAQLASLWPQLDIVYANAGDVTHQPLAEWCEAEWDQLMAVNLKGPFFWIQTLLPLMTASTSVILCGSTSAHIGLPQSSVYAASKAALLSLAKTLSIELKDRGIRVNVLSPGPTQTEALNKLGLSNEALTALQAEIQQLVPIGRMGSPWELAKAAVYLGSDESRFTVGTELLVDGGVASR